MSSVFCTFRIQGKLFGVDVSNVQEVLRAQHLTPIPQAPSVFAGLMNLRGQIVLVIEPKHLLCADAKYQSPQPMFVVLRSNEGPLAIRVDEIGEVVTANPSAFEAIPREDGRGIIASAYKLPRELLLLLNPEAFYTLNTNSKEELN
jgi:purine-binding chemotaxis protein CheW